MRQAQDNHKPEIRNGPDEGLENSRARLAERIDCRTTEIVQSWAAIPELSLFRLERPIGPQSYLQEPSICVIVQGRKRVLLGDEDYVYDPGRYLITSVGLPVIAQVLDANPERPYLGLKLILDQKTLAQLMVDSDLPPPRAQRASRGMAVGRITAPLLDAFGRLIDLLDQPQDVPILAPLIRREILYRLLVGDQGARLRQIAAAGSHGHQISRAIAWLQVNFDQTLRVEDLAARAGMSASAFHHHFRAVTAMSPLQFQKRLRLNEARRLMLAENLDAAGAAFRVGYESPSHFSREYRRQFGAPPLRDIRGMQELGVAEG